MAGRDDYRIFVGGLGWNTAQRHLEDAFSRYGKLLDCLVMVDRETGRPRGFGFITFADRRAMEDAIRDMDGRELVGKVISVNKAEPRMEPEDSYDGYGRERRSGPRDSNLGERVIERSDECFKCGHLGHWARDCPSSGGGGGRYPSRSDYGRVPPKLGDFIPRDSDYERFGGGRYDSRDHFDSRDRFDSRNRFDSQDRFDRRDGYGSRDRYSNDKYPPSNDRFGGDEYMDRYPQNGYGRVRGYERDEGPRANDRYGAGGPARYVKGSYRERAQPYDNPRRSGRR